jgi:hypothetical protein
MAFIVFNPATERFIARRILPDKINKMQALDLNLVILSKTTLPFRVTDYR